MFLGTSPVRSFIFVDSETSYFLVAVDDVHVLRRTTCSWLFSHSTSPKIIDVAYSPCFTYCSLTKALQSRVACIICTEFFNNAVLCVELYEQYKPINFQALSIKEEKRLYLFLYDAPFWTNTHNKDKEYRTSLIISNILIGTAF